MFPPVELIVSAVVGTTAFLLHQLIKKRESAWNATVQTWMRTADALGLDAVSSGQIGRLSMSGRIEGYQVKLESEHDPTLNAFTMMVEMPDVIVTGLKIARLERARLDLRRVVIGDGAVDEHLAISGPEAAILALFDERLRLRVLREINAATRVEGGAIIRALDPHHLDAPRLAQEVRELADFGRALSIDERDIERQLLENAQAEPCLGVRRKIYGLLLAPGNTRPISETAARIGIAEDDPFIRMLSAFYLGPQNFDQVERIAREETLPHEVRLYAFGHLAARGPFLWARGFVGRVMRIDGRSAQRAVLRALVAARRIDLAPAVLEAAEETALSPETMYEVSEALARIGDATAERLLGALLGSPVYQLRVSAAQGLGRIGTVRAVEPLLEVSKNFMEALELRELARGSIRAIQARIADADAGRLSVIEAGEREGAVSYAHEEPGALSFDDV